MNKVLLSCLFAILIASGLNAQGFAWGIKGGPTVGFQAWDGFEREALFAWHGIAFIETISEENKFTLFSQAGYHKRGSAVRVRSFFSPFLMRDIPGQTTKYEFTNLSLSAGAKQKFDFGNNKVYYLFGVRGDYNIDTNLDEFEERFGVRGGFFPFEEAVNDFTLGFIFGGGIEFRFTELIGAVVELTVNPDFTKQYDHPSIPNVFDPFTGNTRTLPERNIRNNTIELSIGFRFLRQVEYID